MLKFATIGATLAAIVSTQVDSSLLSPNNGTNQWAQASTSNLVVTDAIPARTAFTNAQTPTVLPLSTTTLGVKEKVDPAEIILGLAAVGGVAIGVGLSVRNANNPFKSSSTLYHSSSRNPKSTENTIRIDQASRELQKKLLRLLHDERDTANRLLSQVKINNPNRSINWCVEKVIYDLERDRGSY